MPVRNSVPLVWKPHGLTDAVDGTNSFPGAMASLANLIPDPSTDNVWIARPPATQVTSFAGFSSPGFVSALEVIGNRAYGMIATALNSGHDEPFCYDLLNNVFVTISGVTSGNTPTSPATTGDWTPPIMVQAGSRIIVTHPGFNSTTKFGWFDVSGYNQTTIGDLVSGSPVVHGAPDTLGMQPGLAITGADIPSNTTILFAATTPSAQAVSGTSHSSNLIDGIASTTGIFAGFVAVGPGIPSGTTVAFVSANSVTLTNFTTSSVTAEFYFLVPTPVPAGFYTGTLTAGSQTIAVTDTSNLWVGEFVSGLGIPSGASIISIVANTSITINVNATLSGLTELTITGSVIIMSANATGTARETITVSGGTFAAPQWGAGDTQPFNLPSQPVGVAQMSGRAWYACGTDGIVFSDSLFPCQVSNINAVQALTTNDGLAVTAIGPVYLSSLVGGQVQSLIAFEGTEKMQQITGDPDTHNLDMNALPVATGTASPLSLAPCELGLAFISPEGMRIVDFVGRVSPPYGDHGQGITTPFIYATVPSRIAGCANSDTLRWTVINGYKPGDPGEDYWYDIGRKAWHGPHTCLASLAQGWGGDNFVFTFVGKSAALFVQSTVPISPAGSGTFVENGTDMVWQYEPVQLMPDTGDMMMHMLRDMTLACGGPACDPTAPAEAITYTPPVIGAPPVGPGGSTLPPNVPPPPPEQPPPPAPTVHTSTIVVQGASDDGSILWGTVMSSRPAPPTLAFSQGVPGYITTADNTAHLLTGALNYRGALACSRDSLIGCGYDVSGGQPGALWTQGSAETTLAIDASTEQNIATGASNAGEVIIGFSLNVLGTRTNGLFWLKATQGSVVNALPTLVSGPSGVPFGISKDATTIVGSTNWYNLGNVGQPIVWTSPFSATPTALNLPGGHIVGAGIRCSADGSFIVGCTGTGNLLQHACYWSGLGLAAPLTETDVNGNSYDFSTATDCSDDGSVIGGFVVTGAQIQGDNCLPCYWTSNGTNLYILPLAGGTAGWVGAVSGDGKTLGGQHNVGFSVGGIWWSLP